MENYGRFAEVTRLGQKVLPTLVRNEFKFAQQLDPHTGAPSGQTPDGYGPMMLAALEYLTRMHGIHLAVADGHVWWSAVDDTEFTTTQQWSEHKFCLESKDGVARLSVGGNKVLTLSVGTRIVTDLTGRPLRIIGISTDEIHVALTAGDSEKEFTVRPNQVIQLDP